MDASDHEATGELLVDHFSTRYLIYRLTGVICFQAAPIFLGVLLLIGLPGTGCLALPVVVAVTVAVMVASLPGMRVSPSYRIYERGFQPFIKPFRYAFWSFFVPYDQVVELRVDPAGGLLRRPTVLVRRKDGVAHATPLSHLEDDEVLFLAELLAKENPAARTDLGPLAPSKAKSKPDSVSGRNRPARSARRRRAVPGR